MPWRFPMQSLQSPHETPLEAGLHVVANVIELPIRALALVGFAPAKKLSAAERRGTAHLLGRGILGTLWQKRRGAPSWEVVSRKWTAAVADRSAVDPRLYGRFSPSDRITLLTDNAEAFARRTKLYERARTSIDLATYYLHDDAIGRATARSLTNAVRRGVRVRVCADAYIMQKKQYEGRGVMRLVHELREAGVDVRLWTDRRRPYDTNHRKILVVDDEAMLIGGRNIAEHYEGPAWRDVELLVEGPTATQGANVFDRTFRGDTSRTDARIGAVVHSTAPVDLALHPNFLYLLDCLRTAQRTVDIENAYYFSHDAVTAHIEAACKRGVRVRVFTNSAESNDLDYANYRLYTGLRDVLRAGAELWLRRGAGRTLHCKYFVADGAWVSLGSANLDYYSPRYCTEANVHVHDEELGKGLTAWFEEGIADAVRISDPSELESVRRAQSVSRVVDTLLRDVQ